jgi:hypothetical protein
MGRSATLDTTRLLRISSIACAAGAALCVLAGLALGSPAGGAVVGLGLLIGALNPLIAQLLIRLGMPVGISRAWLLVLGVAAAQMVTAIAAAVEMTRR